MNERKIVDYIAVVHSNSLKVNERIHGLISDGYVPFGDLRTSSSSSGYYQAGYGDRTTIVTRVSQAMVKYEQ